MKAHPPMGPEWIHHFPSSTAMTSPRGDGGISSLGRPVFRSLEATPLVVPPRPVRHGPAWCPLRSRGIWSPFRKSRRPRREAVRSRLIRSLRHFDGHGHGVTGGLNFCGIIPHPVRISRCCTLIGLHLPHSIRGSDDTPIRPFFIRPRLDHFLRTARPPTIFRGLSSDGAMRPRHPHRPDH